MTIAHKDIVDQFLNNKILSIIETTKLISPKLRRIATWNTIGIDYAYLDVQSNKTVAFLFFTHLNTDNFMKSTLNLLNSYDSIIACFHLNYLSEANDFCSKIRSTSIVTLPIGVVVFDDLGNSKILKKLSYAQNVATKKSESEYKSYWCWWRDTSQYEVETLLRLSCKYDGYSGDIYTNYIYPEFYELLVSKQTKQWDGKPRNKKPSVTSQKSEKQNYNIPMWQLGLWEQKTGHITPKGRSVLAIIDMYGVDSDLYIQCLAKLILVDGKHLDLIKDVERFQKENIALIPKHSDEFFILFEHYLMNQNSVGTRKPSAVTTGAKKSYIRDEPKLWNKLGLLKSDVGSRYYKPFIGLTFDWERINNILLLGSMESISQ